MRGLNIYLHSSAGFRITSFSILYTKTLSVLGRAMVVCKAALAVGMIKKESSKVLPAYSPGLDASPAETRRESPTGIPPTIRFEREGETVHMDSHQ